MPQPTRSFIKQPKNTLLSDSLNTSLDVEVQKKESPLHYLTIDTRPFYQWGLIMFACLNIIGRYPSLLRTQMIARIFNFHPKQSIQKALKELELKGIVKRNDGNYYYLTQQGLNTLKSSKIFLRSII